MIADNTSGITLSYSLEFTGPGGIRFSEGASHGKAIQAELIAGEWHVSVTASWKYTDPYFLLAGAGNETFIVQAGQKNTVYLEVNPVPDFLDHILSPNIDILGYDGICVLGETTTLAVDVTMYQNGSDYADPATLSYQWYRNTVNSNEGGTAIPGATTETYTTPVLDTEGIYYYYVEVVDKRLETEAAFKKASEVMAVLVSQYYVGASGEAGGIVFYADPNGFMSNGIICHFLEVAPEDWNGSTPDPTAQWGLYGIYAGIYGTSIGDGYANTQDLIAQLNGYGETGMAAQLVDDYNSTTPGGKDDWFLPSFDELRALCTSGIDVGMMESPPPPPYVYYNYWSSTERDYYFAAYFYVNGDSVNWQGQFKNASSYVRPIRAF